MMMIDNRSISISRWRNPDCGLTRFFSAKFPTVDPSEKQVSCKVPHLGIFCVATTALSPNTAPLTTALDSLPYSTARHHLSDSSKKTSSRWFSWHSIPKLWISLDVFLFRTSLTWCVRDIYSFYVSLPSFSFCNLPHMRKLIGVIYLTHSQRNLSLKMIPSMILPRNIPENSVLSWASIWWARRRYLWSVTSSVTSFEISNAVTPTQLTPLHGWAEINR